MIFRLQKEARKTSEKSVDLSCDQQQMKGLGSRYASTSIDKKVSGRQVQSRGSVYLATKRMASMNKVMKIIKDF